MTQTLDASSAPTETGPRPPRRRRGGFLRWAGYVTGAITLAVFAFIGAVAIGLAIGPVSLGPLAPMLLDSMSTVGGYRLTASDALLSWSSERSRLQIRFVDVRIVDDNDVEIATASDIAVSFSISALVEGTIAPRSLEITGPTATFMRLPDGSYDIGIRTESQRAKRVTQTDADITPFVEALLEPPVQGQFNTYLSELTLSNATLTFIDEATQSIVKAPGGTLTVRRTMSGITASLEGQVALPGGNWSFRGAAFYDRNSPMVQIDLNIDDAKLGALAEAGPLFEGFRGAGAPLSGHIEATVSTKGEILWAGAQVSATAGLVRMPVLSNVPIQVKSALIDANYEEFSDLLQLNKLSIDSDAVAGEMTGAFKARRDTAKKVIGWDASFALSGGHINIADFFDDQATVDSLTVDISNDLIADVLTVRKADLVSSAARVSLSGTVSRLAAGTPDLRLNGTVSDLPMTQIGTIWPKGVAIGARDWITANVFAGTITDGTIAIDITAEQMAQARAPDDAAEIVLNFKDAEIAYIAGLPHLQGVTGRALVYGNRFAAEIASANAANLRMSNGTVAINDLVTQGEPARINARIEGKADDLLALIDMQPLGYPSRFGLDPRSVSGDAAVDLGLVVPTWRDLDVEDIGFDIKAKVSRVAMPIARDINLTEGAADFAVTGQGLTANGTGRVAGVEAAFEWTENFAPAAGELSTRFAASTVISEDLRVRLGVDPGAYLDGDAAIQVSMTGDGFDPATASARVDLTQAALLIPELGYRKAVGDPAEMNAELTRVAGGYRAFPVSLTGSGIEAELDILLSRTGALRSITAGRLAAGRNDVAFTVDLSGPQPSVVADVEVIDLDTLIDALTDPTVVIEPADAPEPKAPTTPPNVKMNIKAKRVLLRAGAEARDLIFNVNLDRGVLADLLLQARLGNGSVDAGLWPQADGRRRVVFRSDDMGMVIHGGTGFTSLTGGFGQLDLMFPPRGQAGLPSGTFAMSDFRLIEQPFLVRLLGAGSFEGLIDMLRGEGILFDALAANVALRGDRIEIRELLMRGPSVGATGDGYLDRETDRIEARGTLAGIYSLNSLLGEVPGIGDLLGGKAGLSAITFNIDGTVDELELEVSPLSFLALGALRRLFEFENPLDQPPTAPAVSN